MSDDLRIDPAEPVHEELRRLAAAELDGAIVDLGPEGEPLGPDAIHDVRKRLKRLRALVRLGRGGVLPKPAAAEENAAYRDLGRLLAAHRDAEALGETVERLKAAADEDDAELAGHLDELLTRVQGHAAAVADDLEAVDEARRGLLEARDRVEDWPEHHGVAWDLLEPGFLRPYARGRAAFGATADAPSDEELHAWRKRVKDHWYQLQFLEGAWPKVVKATAKEAHRLADLLGDDHDLAVLAAGTELDPMVAELVASERERLQGAARGLGRRLFAEKPGRLGARFGRYWGYGSASH